MQRRLILPILSSSPSPSDCDIPPQSTQPSTRISAQRRVSVASFQGIEGVVGDFGEKNDSGTLKSGSRAAAIPEGTFKGFATARAVLELEGGREAAKLGEEANIGLDSDKSIKNKGKRKSDTIDVEDEEVEAPKKKPRGRKSKTDDEKAEVKAKPKAKEKKKEPVATTSSHFAQTVAATNHGPVATTSIHLAHPETAIHHEPDETAPASAQKAKVKKPRKPRVEKTTTEKGDATAPKKPRVTKPRAKRKEEKVVSAHFEKDGQDGESVAASKAAKKPRPRAAKKPAKEDIRDVPLSPAKPPKQRPSDRNESLELEEAISRRRDWTPPPQMEDAHEETVLDSAGKQNDRIGKSNFTSLISGYAYAEVSITTPGDSNPTATSKTIVTKRQRLELVDVLGNQAVESQEKAKAPKKKARTITDLVTDQYAPKSAPPEPAVTSDFFSLRTVTTKLPLNDTTNATKPTKKPAQKRVTSKARSENSDADEPAKNTAKPKRVSKAKAAAKRKPMAEKLLSPTSALLRLENQDVLFGTSSQLALEESPTIVRQLQQAISESEFFYLSDENNPSSKKPWPKLGKVEGKRGLWKASARDEVGAVMQRQKAVYMPEPDRTQDFPLLMDESAQDGEPDSPFVDMDVLPVVASNPAPKDTPLKSAPQIIQLSSDLPTPPHTLSATNSAIAEENGSKGFNDSSFVDIDDLPSDLPPSNQLAVQNESSFVDIDDLPTSAQPSITMESTPRSLPVPVSMSRSIKSPKKYEERPKKASATPKESVFAAATRPKPTPRAAASPPGPSVSTPSNRNRFFGIEEILDSEDDSALSPTPPRTKRLPTSQSPPSLPLTSPPKEAPVPSAHALLAPTKKPKPKPSSKTKQVTTEHPPTPVHPIPPSHLDFSTLKPTLFPLITRTLRALPPSTSHPPHHPTWHEKILLYDALILEDFTAWLNTFEDLKVWKRATLKEIKAWNAVLKARNQDALAAVQREGGQDEYPEVVLGVKKELEVWMVQKWCEEMSVCCVLKDKQRGGARRGLY